MDIKHLATKSFDSEVTSKRSIVYQGVPLCIEIERGDNNNVEYEEEVLTFNKNLPERVNIIQELTKCKYDIIKSPIGEIVSRGSDILPLSQIYDYKVQATDTFAEFLPVGATFDNIFESPDVRNFMAGIANSLFNKVNPKTGTKDIDENAFYTPYIPLSVLTGTMTPQISDDSAYFNPEGTVSVAEFLDSLNSIKFGCNSNLRRKKTLDRISDENDYFNEGYQDCLRGISSPFFNLYTRKELTEPITRIELAYIIVICWNRFLEKYNNLFGGDYYLGVNFDWENPAEYLESFNDGFDYKVSRITTNKDYDIVSLNIQDYKDDFSMHEYKNKLKEGVSPLPLPMFMSMIELNVLNLFHYTDARLDPLREVSRGELCYFVTKLAKLFPTKYIK